MSRAPGFSGTPVAGQCSSAANRASCVKSSASGTSRSIRARLVISRGCSRRQTATIVRWMSAAVMAADLIYSKLASRVGERVGHLGLAPSLTIRHPKRANLARPFPARHMIQVQLHEFLRTCQRLLLVAEFEDGVAADDLFCLHERAIDNAELAVRDAHVSAGLDRHQPAAVEHAASLDLPVGALAHRLHQFRRWISRTAGLLDEIHEAHRSTPLEGEPPAPSPRGTVSLVELTNEPRANRHAFQEKD